MTPMISLAREIGHEVSWHEPRLGGMAVARSVRAMAGELTGVRRLVVGDPYSCVIQVIIGVTKVSEVTIVDDGTLPGARGSLNVDDEGTEAERTVLVEQGVLRSYLHDRISARHYGVAPTGSGRRAVGSTGERERP